MDNVGGIEHNASKEKRQINIFEVLFLQMSLFFVTSGRLTSSVNLECTRNVRQQFTNFVKRHFVKLTKSINGRPILLRNYI